jgi:diguanylate cyclase
MRVVSCLLTEHNLWLVALAAFVCTSGILITFGLFQRTRMRTGVEMYGWAFLTAVAAGSSIWCTHFIAMLAYEVTAPVTFDPLLTMASLTIAISGCGLGFGLCALNKRFLRPELCGVIVGVGVVCMHYTGMAAYHVAGVVEWNTMYIAYSVLIAATLSAIAMDEAVRAPRPYSAYLATAWLVLAIVGLHFTGMAAVEVTPMSGVPTIGNAEAFNAIAVAVAGVGLMIIGTGAVSYVIDETSSQQSVAKLRHLALNDSLTDLPNRVHFTDHLAREIDSADKHKQQLAVIGIDLDRFKEINDQWGHGAGDRALAMIGARLRSLMRDGEFIARIGGDEFSAVKRFESLYEVNEFLARIEAALNEPLRINGYKAVTGGSIGVARYPDDGVEPGQLITNADLAMYRAKADSERSVCFYERQMDEASRRRSVLAADLRHAIARNEFMLHYQVQHELSTDEISGYEVLLRWRHPEHGMVSPVEFIPIAEDTGAIVEIGEWVLRTACREAAAWSEPHKIAINVSGVQLRHGDLAEVIHSVLLETALPPRRLEIEITETAIIEDRVRAIHTLRRVKALGVTVAMDDFGIGYSSLETLRTFPFDKIKMDRSFTNGLSNDRQAMAIVRAVLALGKSLDIRVLAEGVETPEQLSILRSEGCDEAQGYLLGRPDRIILEDASRLKVS